MSKSLVRLVEAGRYTVHEVVRAFSAQKLAQLPAVDQSKTLQHYRRWYLGRLQSHTTTHLQPDLENIRAAWINAVAERDRPLLLAAAEQFADLWQALGLLRDGNELLKLALTVVGADDDPASDLAAALLLQISAFTQQIDGASAALDAAYQGLTQTENPRLRTRLYQRAAILLGETQSWDEAAKAHQHHVDEARRSGDRRLLALALHQQAHTQVIHFVGDFAQAIERMELALHLIEDDPESGNMRADMLCGLAIANIRHGDYGQAIAYAHQTLSLGQTLKRRNDQIEALIYLGLAHSFAGLHNQAITYAEEGLVTAEAAGDREGIGLLKANLCLIQRNAGNLEPSLAYGEAALSLLQTLAIHRIEGLCRNRLGHTLLAMSRSAEAAEMYAAACAIWQRLGNPNLYEALAGWAIALAQLGQHQDALHRVEEVLNFAVDDDSLQRVVEPVQMLLHCAQVLQSAGQIARARSILCQAQNWIETIANRNADAAVRHAYLYNIHAHRQVTSALASDSFIGELCNFPFGADQVPGTYRCNEIVSSLLAPSPP
jgi:tetratricopeptide (TPR) repeat protein